jgi:hypothetical protein
MTTTDPARGGGVPGRIRRVVLALDRLSPRDEGPARAVSLAAAERAQLVVLLQAPPSGDRFALLPMAQELCGITAALRSSDPGRLQRTLAIQMDRMRTALRAAAHAASIDVRFVERHGSLLDNALALAERMDAIVLGSPAPRRPDAVPETRAMPRRPVAIWLGGSPDNGSVDLAASMARATGSRLLVMSSRLEDLTRVRASLAAAGGGRTLLPMAPVVDPEAIVRIVNRDSALALFVAVARDVPGRQQELEFLRLHLRCPLIVTGR